MYEFIEFPKFLYSKGQEPRIVQSREEQDELGDEWFEALEFFAEDQDEVIQVQSKKKSKKGVEA